MLRGHRNPAIRTPVVDVHSSLKVILLRLKHQVDSAATLADEAQLGVPANVAEQAVLSRTDEVLRALNDAISPSSSIDCYRNRLNMSALQKCEEEVDSAENFMKMAENLCSEYKEAQDYLNLGKRRFDQLIYQKQKASLKEIKDNMTNLMGVVKKMETDFSAENVENAPNNLSDDSMWLSLESSFQHLKKKGQKRLFLCRK
ncbi:unnamed protein product [Caenorhabditis auriculariae]|uniref:Uncharacterized protein n=1 Tax=Caenorhabditis auriculariae TaxID=2777116 RepID=A0A8S1HZ92_9PELO|nr:unnamed protein product [Caenorhabditis auriculariae]